MCAMLVHLRRTYASLTRFAVKSLLQPSTAQLPATQQRMLNTMT